MSLTRRSNKSPLFIGVVSLLGLQSARGALFPNHEFATDVAAYTQGSVAAYDAGYDDVADWAGIPTDTTGAPEGYPGLVTPFYPPFDADQILVFGNGGHLTLELPNAVTVAPGPSIGVFSTCGFIDHSGSGTVSSTAATFGGGYATVKVSADGVLWFSLGVQDIDVPQCYYQNIGPFDLIPPENAISSDYGRPYTGGLVAFADESNSQVLATFNGSAGGTWLDISSTGLTQIDYIDFSPPPNAPVNWQLAIEAVSTVNPVLVPEPGHSIWLAGLAATWLSAQRDKRRNIATDSEERHR